MGVREGVVVEVGFEPTMSRGRRFYRPLHYQTLPLNQWCISIYSKTRLKMQEVYVTFLKDNHE